MELTPEKLRNLMDAIHAPREDGPNAEYHMILARNAAKEGNIETHLRELRSVKFWRDLGEGAVTEAAMQ